MTNAINSDKKGCGAAVSVEAILARIEKLSLDGKLEMLEYIQKNFPE